MSLFRKRPRNTLDRVQLSRLCGWLCLVVVWPFAPVIGWAASSAITIRYFTKVPQGQTPRVELTAQEPLDKLSIRLKRDDGETVEAIFGATSRGQTPTVKLDDSLGKHHYTADVVVAAQGGAEQTSRLSFEAQVTGELQVQVDRRTVDLAAGKLTLIASRPVAEVQITTYAGVSGPGQTVRQPFSGTAAGEALEVRFPAAPTVARLDVKVTDADGFYTGVSLRPWSVKIPHEEVNFATGKAEVVATEQPKLDASLKLINQALKQARSLGAVALYIAGHTDTVGNDASNLKLSHLRAEAIARALRKKGLKLPIFFEGFGERALAVATPDQTDEARNRRVDYILALEPPDVGARDFQPRWKPLP